jgi:hypothetical protein
MQMKQQQFEADTTLRGLELQLKEKEIRIKEIDLGIKNMAMENEQDLRREKLIIDSLNSEATHVE